MKKYIVPTTEPQLSISMGSVLMASPESGESRDFPLEGDNIPEPAPKRRLF